MALINQELRKIAIDVDQLADGLGKDIDQKIKPIVIALRAHHFMTHASCEGHLNWGLPYPWVEMSAPFDMDIYDPQVLDINILERKRLENILEKFYSSRDKDLHCLKIEYFGKYEIFRLQSVVGINVYDKHVKDENMLKLLQDEMNHFSNFLLKKFLG